MNCVIVSYFPQSAEKRKTMLDDLAIQTQTIKQQHEAEMDRVSESHEVGLNILCLSLMVWFIFDFPKKWLL